MRRIVFILGLLLSLNFTSSAQLNTLYLSNHVAASQWKGNPAYQGNEKVYLYALPGLSSLDFSAGNTGFKYNDGVSGSQLNFSTVIDELKPMNHVLFDNHISLIGAGMRLGHSQFRIGMDVVNQMRFGYPGDFLELLWKGNGHPDVIGRQLDMSGLGFNFMSYYDYYFGYSRRFMDDKLTVGANIHLLQGIETIYTKTSEFSFYTDPNDYALTASGAYNLQTSLPADSVDIDEGRYIPLQGAGNNGFALDLGAEYQFSERLKLQASIMNLGSITWENEGRSFVLDGVSVTYDGLELEDLYDNNDSLDSGLEHIGDSIADKFTLDERFGGFTTPTNARYIMSADYSLSEKSTVQFTYAHMRSFQHGFNTVAAMYRRDFGKLFWLQSGVQFFEFRHLLIPVSFQFNPGPVQIAVGTNNLISGIAPRDTKFVSGYFSLSFRFGKDSRKPRQSSGDSSGS